MNLPSMSPMMLVLPLRPDRVSSLVFFQTSTGKSLTTLAFTLVNVPASGCVMICPRRSKPAETPAVKLPQLSSLENKLSMAAARIADALLAPRCR